MDKNILVVTNIYERKLSQKILTSNIYTARLHLKTCHLKKRFLKRSVFTLDFIMDLFSLNRSDETLYLKKRLFNGWSQL